MYTFHFWKMCTCFRGFGPIGDSIARGSLGNPGGEKRCFEHVTKMYTFGGCDTFVTNVINMRV